MGRCVQWGYLAERVVTSHDQVELLPLSCERQLVLTVLGCSIGRARGASTLRA